MKSKITCHLCAVENWFYLNEPLTYELGFKIQQIPLPGVTVPLIKTENVEALRSCCRAVMLS